MLVLSRKERESVIIKIGGIEIKVTLCEIRGEHVRIGFDAPNDAKILREELIDDMKPSPTL